MSNETKHDNTAEGSPDATGPLAVPPGRSSEEWPAVGSPAQGPVPSLHSPASAWRAGSSDEVLPGSEELELRRAGVTLRAPSDVAVVMLLVAVLLLSALLVAVS